MVLEKTEKCFLGAQLRRQLRPDPDPDASSPRSRSHEAELSRRSSSQHSPRPPLERTHRQRTHSLSSHSPKPPLRRAHRRRAHSLSEASSQSTSLPSNTPTLIRKLLSQFALPSSQQLSSAASLSYRTTYLSSARFVLQALPAASISCQQQPTNRIVRLALPAASSSRQQPAQQTLPTINQSYILSHDE